MVPPGSGAQQYPLDVHKERLRGNIRLWRWDVGLEAASREVLQRRDVDGGQSSRSACAAAPRIRRGSGRLLRLQSRADDRLSEAGEAITETLFKALVTHGLPDSYEHFVVQESFQPARTFPELRTRLRNYDDSRKARCGERTELGHVAMQAVRKKKGESSSGCNVCGQKGHMARDCKFKSDSGQCSARGSESNEANGPGAKKQTCFKCGRSGHFARLSKQGKTGFFSCYAAFSMKGDDLIVDTGCTDHVVRDTTVFSSFESWNEGTTVDCGEPQLHAVEDRGQRISGSGDQGLP